MWNEADLHRLFLEPYDPFHRLLELKDKKNKFSQQRDETGTGPAAIWFVSFACSSAPSPGIVRTRWKAIKDRRKQNRYRIRDETVPRLTSEEDRCEHAPGKGREVTNGLVSEKEVHAFPASFSSCSEYRRRHGRPGAEEMSAL